MSMFEAALHFFCKINCGATVAKEWEKAVLEIHFVLSVNGLKSLKNSFFERPNLLKDNTVLLLLYKNLT